MSDHVLSDTDRIVVIGRTDRVPHSLHHLTSEEELLRVIDPLLHFQEGTFSICPFGFRHDRESLLCGIDSEWAFAHFTPRDPSDCRTPLWAVSSTEKVDTTIGFNIGGTLTEISLHRCISIPTMIRIAKYYLRTISLLPDVAWQAPQLDD